MKEVITKRFKEIGHDLGISDDRIGLILLEDQRVRKREVRELLTRCDIKNVNPMKNSIKSFSDLMDYFLRNSRWKILKLYNELMARGEYLMP